MTTFTGGIRIGTSYWGAINYTWPCAKFIFEECSLKIVVSFIRKNMYILSYDDITRISSKKGLFSNGVLIEHHSEDIPSYIFFWTRKSKLFLDECARHRLPI